MCFTVLLMPARLAPQFPCLQEERFRKWKPLILLLRCDFAHRRMFPQEYVEHRHNITSTCLTAADLEVIIVWSAIHNE